MGRATKQELLSATVLVEGAPLPPGKRRALFVAREEQMGRWKRRRAQVRLEAQRVRRAGERAGPRAPRRPRDEPVALLQRGRQVPLDARRLASAVAPARAPLGARHRDPQDADLQTIVAVRQRVLGRRVDEDFCALVAGRQRRQLQV